MVVVITSCGKDSSNNSKKNKYFSLSWAQKQNRYPGGKNASPAKRSYYKKVAISLEKRGFLFYKKKNNHKAVQLYKKALSKYATARIYYKFGNSLSNIHLLKDSISAYNIAIGLGYSKKHLVYYNIACAYSRLSQLSQAKAMLKKAVSSGYRFFSYIRRDPDLKNLRNSSHWKGLVGDLRFSLTRKQNLVVLFNRYIGDKQLEGYGTAGQTVIEFSKCSRDNKKYTGSYAMYVFADNPGTKPRRNTWWSQSGTFEIKGNIMELSDYNSYRFFMQALKIDIPDRKSITLSGSKFTVRKRKPIPTEY